MIVECVLGGGMGRRKIDVQRPSQVRWRSTLRTHTAGRGRGAWVGVGPGRLRREGGMRVEGQGARRSTRVTAGKGVPS